MLLIACLLLQPFLHSLVFTIDKEVSSEKVIPTVMAAFALSSVITGLVFFALGALKSGRLLEFFPRHVLCGCIGGIGAFLFITGYALFPSVQTV